MGLLKDYTSTGRGFETELFKEPDNCLYPVFFWLWNARITREGIVSQLDDMCRADIRGFSVIPEPPTFRPTSMVTELDPPYLSDEFMELIRFTAEQASERGMVMWLYDEGGWPSGGAGGLVCQKDPALARKILHTRTLTLPAGEVYDLPSDAVAAFIGDERIPPTHSSGKNETVTEYFRCTISDYFSDVTEPRTVSAFIELTHERYKQYVGEYFGSTIPLFFTDEPIAHHPAFPYGFEDIFFDRYGYDILDYLPLLFRFEGLDREGQEIREDYLQLCQELLKENFLGRCADWCHGNGLLFCGHLDVDHYAKRGPFISRSAITDMLGTMDVPGIDVIVRQVMPCGKAEDPADSFFPRIAPTAARINGNNLALSESFAVYGSGLTAEQMRYILNYQFVRGINLMSFMTITYGKDRFLSYVERPSFTSEMPGYENLVPINVYTARASYLTSLGESDIDTALYLPSRELYRNGSFADAAYLSYNALGKELESKGIAFDIIDDRCLAAAEFTAEGIRIGRAFYKHVYLPEPTDLDAETASALAPFIGGATPYVKSSEGFGALRVLTRRLPNDERLWFFFNEGKGILSSELTLPCVADRLYKLDMSSGTMYALPCTFSENGAVIRLEFQSGESTAILSSPHNYPTADDPTVETRLNTILPDSFSVSKKTETFLLKEGIVKRACAEDFVKTDLGPWKELFGESFSGDAVYRTTVSLPVLPKCTVEIGLGRVEYSAAVYVNGSLAGYALAQPNTVYAESGLFTEGENVIDIVVSNTSANQYVLSDTDGCFEEREVGCYHPVAKRFEAETLGGGLYGPVKVKY
ncbi:MAG: hypothetical protein IKM04_03380 [Clostridia bacterium]|nr:hypothetical protein [Clostridia bacterium]